MPEKIRDMLGASSMILLMVAAIILGLGIKNMLTVRPASAYEDKGVHTFTPIEIYPVQKKNTSSYGRSRRMNPTTTVYKVRYEATDGSGYRCSFEAGSTETSAQLLAEEGDIERRVLYVRAVKVVLAGGLAQPDTAPMAQQALRRQLDPDPDGWKMLTVMLCAACLAQQPMEQQGMGMDVYLATMGMFSRFVKEHSRQFGRCGFDRDWWTWRILCGRLVRLGALEYEQAEYQGPAFAGMVPGQPCLHLHIPSDADLSDQARRQSYARAWARWELSIVCESWLLAPALDKLLPADSRLRRFRAEFVPGPAEEDAEDVYQWLFQGEKRLDRLPQTTSLQRAAKAWLEEDKKIGIGWGRLRWPE